MCIRDRLYTPPAGLYNLSELKKSAQALSNDLVSVSYTHLHYHQDHVQGIIAAMENIKVRNLFLPDNREGSEWRSALENTERENGTTVHYIDVYKRQAVSSIKNAENENNRKVYIYSDDGLYPVEATYDLVNGVDTYTEYKIPSAIALSTSIAVSYTHLDVYKRQRRCCYEKKNYKPAFRTCSYCSNRALCFGWQ